MAMWLLSVSLGGGVASAQQADRVFEVAQPEPAALTLVLEQVRELRAGGITAPVTVILPSGTYRFTQPIELTPAEVGDGLTLRAREAGEAVLSGGRLLETIESEESGRWRYALPEGWRDQGLPRVLVINGGLRSAARFPNEGYERIESAFADRRSGFVMQADALPPRVDLQKSVCDVVLLHDWSSSRMPVASLDVDKRELKTLGPIGCAARHYAIDHFEKQPRYWLEGAEEFADQPGEWFIDQEAGEVVVLGGDGFGEAPQVVLPWLDTVLIAKGTESAPLKRLVVRGVTFTETRFAMPSGGLAGAQATMHEPRTAEGNRTSSGRVMLEAGVHVERAGGCRFENCRFLAMGGSGLWLGSRVTESVVFRCKFDEIGGNGLNLGEDNNRRSARAGTDGNRVEQCEVSHCGEVLPGAVAIWAPLNRRLEIVKSHIHDCSYTGISLGWIWSEAESPAGENRIADNRIEFVMQKLSDGGGIYTLGRQPESVIEENVLSDIPLNAGRAESNGMFLDEGSSGFVIKRNTIRRIDRSPLRFHKAGKNLVRDNRWELATPETPPVRFNNTPVENITIEENEVVPPEQRVFLIGNSLTWDTIPSRLDGNVHWHVDCGKSLKYIFEHTESPCVRTSRLWPEAFQTAQYDIVTVQPHYGTTLDEDVEVISRWMELQPHAEFVLHTAWARHATIDEEFADDDPAGPLTHSRTYIVALRKKLLERNPGRTIRVTPCTLLVHRIAEDIREGRAPLKDIAEFYRDSIHMTLG
ncbi:Beta_helix domain-containing protein, partial [Durusdinium trenchii]